jgi:hypothetical protein
MDQSTLLTVAVECYAGHRGEETPRAFAIGGRRLAVTDVLDRWLAPDHRYFKLRTEDNDLHILRHDVTSGRWELTVFQASRYQATPHPDTPNDRLPIH